MLPRKLRLPYQTAARLRRLGTRVSTRDLLLIYSNQTNYPQSRWLIQVPKQVYPLSTARNRLKRMFSETLRSKIILATPIDAIVTIRRKISPTVTEVSRVLRAVLTAAKLA